MSASASPAFEDAALPQRAGKSAISRRKPNDGTSLAPTGAATAERCGPAWFQGWSVPAVGALVFALAAIFYVANGVAPVIYDDNEGLYAGAVREMQQQGEWLVPTNNGLPRIQKPILTYWAMLVSTSVFGVNEFAVRMPNALATAAWIWATFLIGTALRGVRHGVMSAAVLASMLGTFVFTHLVQPEPFLATFLSLAVYCFIRAWQANADPDLAPTAGRWFLGAWACMALGSMSKGLHGALYPMGIVLISMVLWPQARRFYRPFFTLAGVGIFLLIVVPWYVALEAKLPGFVRDHFLNEQFGHATNSRYPSTTRGVSFLAFYLQHLIFWSPWVLAAPAALLIWWRRRTEARKALTDAPASARAAAANAPWPLDLFVARTLTVWVALTFISLSFSKVQDYYAMSCWGAVALFLAWPWTGEVRVSRWFTFTPGAILGIAGVALLVLALGFGHSFAPSPEGAAVADTANRDTFANALAGLPTGAWESFIPLMIGAGAAMLLGGGAAMYFAWRQHLTPAFTAITLVMGVMLSLATCGFAIMSPNFSLAEQSRMINQAAPVPADALVACESEQNVGSSLLFYLNHRVHWVNALPHNDFATRVLGQGAELYLNTGTLLPHWVSNKRVFLIVEQSRQDFWRKTLSVTRKAPHVLGTAGSRVVLVNYQPAAVNAKSSGANR
ncbi:hypothetical protein DB346_17710 [Verrucomicrobia bacterium LW23]|nr:hypothetical protein DB346_17710 [Verrucomicrobia bacterium LW23]